MRRLLAVGGLALALSCAALVLAPTQAQACSCVEAPPPVEYAREVGLVFEGELVSVEDIPPSSQYDLQSKAYTFEVTRSFKGEPGAQVRVMSAASGAACGRSYGDPGDAWLVYARVDDAGQARDNICSRSRPMADAAEDISALEAADSLEPLPAPPPIEPGPADPEPQPILPDPGEERANDDGPEPAQPGKKGCSVSEDPEHGGLGSLGLLLGLGLGLGWIRRRR